MSFKIIPSFINKNISKDINECPRCSSLLYKEFRYERNRQMSKSTPDINKIVDRLDKWATNPNYRDCIKQIIEDNLKEIKD